MCGRNRHICSKINLQSFMLTVERGRDEAAEEAAAAGEGVGAGGGGGARAARGGGGGRARGGAPRQGAGGRARRPRRGARRRRARAPPGRGRARRPARRAQQHLLQGKSTSTSTVSTLTRRWRPITLAARPRSIRDDFQQGVG